MHLAEQDRDEYTNERGAFIGVCPECGAEIDEWADSFLDSGIIAWYCDCGRNIFADEAYSI